MPSVYQYNRKPQKPNGRFIPDDRVAASVLRNAVETSSLKQMERSPEKTEELNLGAGGFGKWAEGTLVSAERVPVPSV